MDQGGIGFTKRHLAELESTLLIINKHARWKKEDGGELDTIDIAKIYAGIFQLTKLKDDIKKSFEKSKIVEEVQDADK